MVNMKPRVETERCVCLLVIDYTWLNGLLLVRKVNRTQRAIKHVLTERYYAWQEAVELAKSDPTVTLSGAIPAYNPMALEVGGI